VADPDPPPAACPAPDAPPSAAGCAADAGALRAARRIADTVLAPAAAATDLAALLPRENLDALADAGLYGLGSGPESFLDICAVIETLAAACLTTTLVWTQHLGTVHQVGATENAALRERFLPRLLTGEVRSGAAFTGGALPGPAALHASPDGAGWRFDGFAPWVSGWGRNDVMHAAARTTDGRIVWALLDAVEGDGIRVEPLALLAVNASATVRATFTGAPVPAARVTAVAPGPEGAGVMPAAVRFHAAMALGVAGRCCALLGPSPLDAELEAVREALDAALEDPGGAAIVASRAAVSELAVRAATALLATHGARAVAVGDDAGRLAREALFLAVFGSRAPIRAALLSRLHATP
jgi:alkylation response protein AidB-like acyl-CoA dehydrogenase